MVQSEVWMSGIGMDQSWRDLASTYVLHSRVIVSLISGDRGQIRGQRFGDDFIDKDRSQTRRIQVVEQEEDLRDKCSERTMSKISRDSN